MMYTCGISREGDLMDLAMADKLVEKSGSWFNYGDLRLGQGRENVKQFMKDNPEIFKSIDEKVRKELGLTHDAVAEPVGV
jgi:recombination protein RecA